jgi:hypothetical protein
MQDRKLMEVDDEVWKKIKIYCISKEIKMSEFIDVALRAELTKRGIEA